MCSHSDCTHSLNSHTKALSLGPILLSSLTQSAITQPCMFSHLPALLREALCLSLPHWGTAGFRAAKWPSRQLPRRQRPGTQAPLCTCAGRSNVRRAPQGTFELHLSFLSRVCCLRDGCAWYQGSFGAAHSARWGSTLRAW